MDLNYIREFVVLANTCNYMEAAEQLFISQSALSRHIKNLEEELGVSLFDRSTRSVTLNAFGMLFLPYARQMAALHHEYATALGNALNAEHGNIRIGSIPMMSHYGITDVMVRFRKENPRFTLDVIEGDSNRKCCVQTNVPLPLSASGMIWITSLTRCASRRTTSAHSCPNRIRLHAKRCFISTSSRANR